MADQNNNNTQSQQQQNNNNTVATNNEPGFFAKTGQFFKRNWKPLTGGLVLGTAIGTTAGYFIFGNGSSNS